MAIRSAEHSFCEYVIKVAADQKMSCHVLLIDDDPGMAGLIPELLPPPVFEIHTVCDGAEALSRLRESEFDIILLDLMLPHVNGFEILRELKSRDQAMLERTIVLTAASDVTLGAFDQSQVFRLLRKPVAWSGLMRAIRDCMDARRRSSSTAETFELGAAKVQ